jgi:hypothetical protein
VREEETKVEIKIENKIEVENKIEEKRGFFIIVMMTDDLFAV